MLHHSSHKQGRGSENVCHRQGLGLTSWAAHPYPGKLGLSTHPGVLVKRKCTTFWKYYQAMTISETCSYVITQICVYRKKYRVQFKLPYYLFRDFRDEKKTMLKLWLNFAKLKPIFLRYKVSQIPFCRKKKSNIDLQKSVNNVIY